MKTSTFRFAMILLFSLSLISGCEDESNSGNPELVQNPSIENGNQSPSSWFPSDYADSDTQVIWSDVQAYDGIRSLQLSSDNADASAGWWGQTYEDKIPHGKKLRLSCKIKLDNVVGDGVSIAFRGDNNTKPEFFYSTQGKINITGNHDWEEFSVEMDTKIPDTVVRIYIFLIMLNNTTGSVYFDDVSLKKI
ncbi:MAG TPA: hypothetical protein VFW11_24470 [Cyclobacteriaceae bacterium]|nr:hypothetical protein [Cyclobacteriaceae bacterium]